MIPIEKVNEVGDRVYFKPHPLHTYEYLVQSSLGSNTYRGFHRKDKNRPGASTVFRNILNRNKNMIVESINGAKSENDLDDFLKKVCHILRQKLRANIRADQLTSFNKIRKPMDIVVQHMVAMGEDFTDAKAKIIDWLFLPLDSQMFQSKFVFNDQEVRGLKIKRTFTFTSIKTGSHYKEIQKFLKKKATEIGIKHRIYFDLIWNERYKSNGTNLFLTNPKKPNK